MRKGLAGVLMLSGALFILNSCKDDPEPPSLISFTDTSLDVIESDGTLKSFSPEIQAGSVGQSITVKITFDRPMAESSTISYTVSGTASRQTTIKTNGSSQYKDYSDFYLDGTNAKDTESLIINKGDTEASIPITIFEDTAFEDDETIILTLTSVVNGPAKLSDTNLDYIINIKEDDTVIALDWIAADAPDQTNTPKWDVDLDVYAFLEGDVASGSANQGTDYEIFNIPGGLPAGTYSFSYPYFSGSSNNVEFAVYMLTTAGTLNGKSYPYSDDSAPPLSFAGNYTLSNVNPYTDPAQTTIAQTMVKSGINYTGISDITAHDSGSRKAPLTFNKSILKNVKMKSITPSFKGR